MVAEDPGSQLSAQLGPSLARYLLSQLEAFHRLLVADVTCVSGVTCVSVVSHISGDSGHYAGTLSCTVICVGLLQ